MRFAPIVAFQDTTVGLRWLDCIFLDLPHVLAPHPLLASIPASKEPIGHEGVSATVQALQCLGQSRQKSLQQSASAHHSPFKPN